MRHNNKKHFRAIDLFAGIGGIRLAFERAGFDVIYSNDNDKYACITYADNFGDIDNRDIKEIKNNQLPDFDVLLAGFPCQPFSKLGRKLGFSDPRGNLFFEIERILHSKKPEAFFLENVRHLEKHDKGVTFQEISKALEGRLGYKMYSRVLNARDFGLPQSRERIYIVGFREDIPFSFPKPRDIKKVGVKSILEKKVNPKYFLSKKYFDGLKKHKNRHRAKGHGFGFEILNPKDAAYTLVAGNMGRERNLIRDKLIISKYTADLTPRNKEGIRKLTVREYARLQGFPDSFSFPVSDNQAYKQIGNSVCVPVVHAIAKRIRKALEKTYS